MHDDSPFLRQILAHPFDDGPRLVYADRLDELGDPRGEFIRVQCELARLESDRGDDGQTWKPFELKRRDILRRRERELIPRAWWAWCCPDPLKGRQWSVCRDQSEIAVYAAAGPPEVELTFQIRRGLVGTVTLTCLQFFGGPCWRCGDRPRGVAAPGGGWATCPVCRGRRGPGRIEGVAAALFAAAPITEVRLSDREPDSGIDGRRAWWYTDPDWHRPGARRHWLPVELRPYLTGSICEPVDWPRPGVCGFDYGNLLDETDGVALARADCSAACVALGRDRAELPALARVVGIG
jgi:uncharacterized protein (TIGR02996 family)